ncbi:hypothetical protein RDI58_017691 [Solanum bulbocastanum]|uniref:Uncharacterized protein n=1 Tax=Solanum bulbocastanum TaxID=147425 RepID=A0AAN8TFX4_SOLBU
MVSATSLLLFPSLFRHFSSNTLVSLTRHKHKSSSLPLVLLSSSSLLRSSVTLSEALAQKIAKSIRRLGTPLKAWVYTDNNVIRLKEY